MHDNDARTPIAALVLSAVLSATTLMTLGGAAFTTSELMGFTEITRSHASAAVVVEPVHEDLIELDTADTEDDTGDFTPVGPPPTPVDVGTPPRRPDRTRRPPRAHAVDPLVALEPLALQGLLSYDEIHTLERELARAERLTRKNKISRILLNDAQAKSNWEQWKNLAERHLDEIDQSDPALSLGYAEVLWRTDGNASADRVIQLADLTLETRGTWHGKTYVTNTDHALRLRALAYSGLWERTLNGEEVTFTKQRFWRKNVTTTFHYPSDVDKQRAEFYRARVKDSSVEWCDFRSANRMSMTQPEQVYLTAVPGGDGCLTTGGRNAG